MSYIQTANMESSHLTKSEIEEFAIYNEYVQRGKL